jgi:hypothetical protein
MSESQWVWVSDVRSGEQLRAEIGAWVAGGARLASITGIDCVYEVWTTPRGFLLVDVGAAGPIGYAAHSTYPAALQAVMTEIQEQEAGWYAGPQYG